MPGQGRAIESKTTAMKSGQRKHGQRRRLCPEKRLRSEFRNGAGAGLRGHGHRRDTRWPQMTCYGRRYNFALNPLGFRRA